MSYPIRAVVELTGIPRPTLLAWERRYGVPEPARVEGGRRVYSDEDLELIRELQGLTAKGFRIGEAVEQVRRRRRGVARAAAMGESSSGSSSPLVGERAALFEALVGFDRAAADRVTHRLSVLSFRRRIDEVIIPLLQDVGLGWQRGELSVAQEHYASAFCRELLITMLHQLESGPSTGRTALCAGVPGEEHELGLLAVAVKLALDGWRVTYLGTNLPTEDLVEVATTQGHELVCQSLVAPRAAESIVHYARHVRERLPDATLLALGGPALEALDGFEEPGLLMRQYFCDLLPSIEAAHQDLRRRTA